MAGRRWFWISRVVVLPRIDAIRGKPQEPALTPPAARIIREVDLPQSLGDGWGALRQFAEIAPPDLREALSGQKRRDELEALKRQVATRLWEATLAGTLAGERPLSPLHQESVWSGAEDATPPQDLLWLADVLDFLVALLGPQDTVVFAEPSP